MEGLFAPWHSLGKSITSFRQGLEEAEEEFSGVMKETTDVSEPTETKVAGSSTPAAPVATVLAQPAIAEPTVETIEKPAEPAARL